MSQMLALIGFKLVWPFLPLYLGDLGVPDAQLPLWAGSLDFVEEMAAVVASPIWGALADRYGRKLMVVRAMLGGAAVVLLIAAAQNAIVVLGLMVLSGVLTGVSAPLNALVAAATPSDQLGRSMGRMLSCIFLANSVGPLIGGVLVDRLGFRGGFVCGGGLLLAAALLVIFLISEQRPSTQPESSGRSDPADDPADVRLRTQLRRMGRVPGFRAVLVASGVLYLANLILYPIIAIIVPKLSGVPTWNGTTQLATGVGLALGVTGLTGMVSAWRTHVFTDRWGYRRTLVVATSVAAALNLLMFFSDSFWWLVAVRAGAGLFLGVAQAALGALVGITVPRALHGTAYGLAGSVQSAATAVGFLLGGTLGYLLGLHAVFLVSGLLLTLVTLLASTTLRSLRALEGGKVQSNHI